MGFQQDLDNVARMLPHNGISRSDPWVTKTSLEVVSLSRTIKGMTLARLMVELQNIEAMLPGFNPVDRQAAWDQAIAQVKAQYGVS